jgi:2,3-bisphosphoglycerate-independent phosphoglycerate mutase
MSSPRIALVIIDGIGLDQAAAGNVVNPERLPTLFNAMDRNGFSVLEASGPEVGLYEGQVGNSEVGHLTIGAGRRLPSMLARIDNAFANGSWANHPAWVEIGDGSPLHIVGLLSDAGVHAHWSTMLKATRLACDAGVTDIIVHPILDGMDSSVGSAGPLLDELTKSLPDNVRLGVVMGRKWFCDRSGDYSITAEFIRAVCQESSELPPFDRHILDQHVLTKSEAEFPPHLMPGGSGILPNDHVIHASHRADRALQAVKMLARSQRVYTMTSITDETHVPHDHVFLPVVPIEGGLADIFKKQGIRTTRIAEACKFPHVTFFLNGYRQCVGSERHIEVPSSHSDLARFPEMNLARVVDATERAMLTRDNDVIVVNLSNLDQVGHLGNLAAAQTAADAVEAALKRIATTAKQNQITLVLMSDHGNADRIIDTQGRPFVGHTEMPVPFTIVPSVHTSFQWRHSAGSLTNVAPSLLALLGIPIPQEMGQPLIDVVPSVYAPPANLPTHTTTTSRMQKESVT